MNGCAIHSQVNATGVMPVIFASSLLVAPSSLARFTDAAFLKTIAVALFPGGKRSRERRYQHKCIISGEAGAIGMHGWTWKLLSRSFRSPLVSAAVAVRERRRHRFSLLLEKPFLEECLWDSS